MDFVMLDPLIEEWDEEIVMIETLRYTALV